MPTELTNAEFAVHMRFVADVLDSHDNAWNKILPAILRTLRKGAGIIEALTAENAALKAAYKRCLDCPIVCVKDLYLKMSEENETLQEETTTKDAEIERLKAKANQWRKTSESNFASCERLSDDLARVTAERDNLLASEIHAHWVGDGSKKHCSSCGMDFDIYAYQAKLFLRCPCCGARMDAEETTNG